MKAFLVAIILICNTVKAQNNIAQFAVWKPKKGLKQKFEDGYKQHLQWHKSNGDTWSWYGWYIISGQRAGYFIDATFDHSWNDWNMPVNPAGDRTDNQSHTEPFGDFITAFKVAQQPELSAADSTGLRSKFLRMLTLSVKDIPVALKVVDELKSIYTKKFGIANFQTYKMIDGGNVNELIILLGFSDYNEFGRTEHLQEDISAIESSLKAKVVTAIKSETLLYQAGMSLLRN